MGDPGNEDVTRALLKLYRAIAGVSQTVADLPLSDQLMLPLMSKIDELNEASRNLRTAHAKQASTAFQFQPGGPLTRDREDTGPKESLNDANLVSMEERLNLLCQENAQLKASLTSIGQIAASLAADQKTMKQRLTRAESKVKDLVTLQMLFNKLGVNVQGRKEMEKQLLDLNSELQKTNISVETLQSFVLDNLGDSCKPVCAFHAQALKCETSYHPGDTIKFQHVFLNASDCYDVDTSTFTAPIDGLYFFAVSVNTNTPEVFAAKLTNSNGDELGLIGTPPVKDLQTSTSIVTVLSKGEKIMVKIYGLSSLDGVQPGGGFSNFIGFLLK